MKPFQTSHPEEHDAEGSLWNPFHPCANWPARQQLYTDGKKPTEKAHYHKYCLKLFPLTEIWLGDLKIQHIMPNK
jgi:hypothetical protein